MSTRFRITVEYDGRPFVGWQRQKDALSVQECLETAVSVLALDGENILVTGSGRTDAGVHAWGQVAHLDLQRDISADKVQGAMNYHLKQYPISVLHAEVAAPDFHARFDARQRHYVYTIVNRRSPLTFDRGLKWHVHRALDAEKMHAAAQVLVGRHDFTTFRHVHCQSQSPLKTLDYIKVDQQDDHIYIRAGARSFLHHQIRSFTGCLKLVGSGEWSPQDLQDALYAKDRAALGLNAPSDGLYFMRVDY